jgi:hypothetical protein
VQVNVGTVDKAVRVVAGVALLAYAFVGKGQWRWLGLFGVVPLLTAWVGFCPVYTLLGIKTNAPAAKP